jgi:hypothetical protein
LSDQIVTALLDHLDGLNVGDGKQPPATGWQGPPGQSPFVSYSIVWRIGSLDLRSSTIEDRFDEERPTIFIRSFGATRLQAEQQDDAVRNRMLHTTVTVPGRVVQRTWLENSQTTTVTDRTEVGLFEAGSFFRIWTNRTGDPSDG